MNTSIIRFENVSFAYVGKKEMVIKDFNFEIPMGSRTALLGLNGTGKTTLLLLILGYITPINGKIVLEEDGQEKSIKEMNGSIGYLSQSENIPFDYTVQEFIMLGRAPHILKFNVPSESDLNVIIKILEALELSALATSKLGEISGGELQRVRIARTLAQEPKIILMDEPMTHLDIKNKKYLNGLITNLKESGKTIIYSTHDPLDVLNFSDRCIIFGKNNKYETGETEKIIQSRLLSNYFEIPITVINENGKKSIVIH
jgi:ABC-type cobalamin/Fe3+-siderophores transport system ATPase subunit